MGPLEHSTTIFLMLVKTWKQNKNVFSLRVDIGIKLRGNNKNGRNLSTPVDT